MKQTTLHKAETRGHADFGWLKSYHTFSFGNYHDPSRMHFGALRVLNDDFVSAGEGFGTHPHQNMEIISIPTEGVIEHRDSMGNHGLIPAGEIQVMSAGTGIQHSEFNHSKENDLRFFQIWIIPNKAGVAPRYQQMAIPSNEKNKLIQILSPNENDEGVWIHQDVWFHLANMDQGAELNYVLKNPETHGVYVFVIEGEVNADGEPLNRRDGYGLTGLNSLDIVAISAARVLLMEVPL